VHGVEITKPIVERIYWLITGGRWIREDLPWSWLTEVDPSEVLQDLRENEIPIPKELEGVKPPPPIVPRWDSVARQLWYRDIVCRDFDVRDAPAQIRIVETFHKAAWKETIPAPFFGNQLRDNIRNLNKSMTPDSPINFAPKGALRMTWKLR
jgi:hypothetical protein